MLTSCLVGLGAVGLAAMLDTPVGAGSRDEATPIVAGPVVGPGEEPTGGPDSLPPLTLVLDRPPPDGIGALPPEEQVPRLSDLAERGSSSRRFLELGVALQALQRFPEARQAFERAVAIEPGDPAARTGLIVTGAAESPTTRPEAAAALAALQKEHPKDQLVSFNHAWVTLYDGRLAESQAALQHTIALAPTTPLAATARQVREALRAGQGRPPSVGAPGG